MFNIEYISLLAGEESENYIEAFNDVNCSVEIRDSYEKIGLTRSIDGIVVFEESFSTIGQTSKFITEMKKESNVMIWLVVAEEIASVRAIYLQMGVDGTFIYGKDKDESVLTIANSLRRYKEPLVEQKIVSENANKSQLLQLNSRNLSVIVEDGKEVPLTKLEYKILELLMENAGQAVTYEEIYKKLWNCGTSDNQVRVSNVIFHLRKKIEGNPSDPEFVRTVRSKGYLLNV